MQNPNQHSLNEARYSSGLNVLLGIWIIASPFILTFTDNSSALWNDIIVGAVVLILGLVRLSSTRMTSWASWVNLILGLWMVVAPYVLTYSDITNALWNNIVLGIAVAILAAWSIFFTHQAQSMPR
jgi:sulfite exporter TauE/SafE